MRTSRPVRWAAVLWIGGGFAAAHAGTPADVHDASWHAQACAWVQQRLQADGARQGLAVDASCISRLERSEPEAPPSSSIDWSLMADVPLVTGTARVAVQARAPGGWTWQAPLALALEVRSQAWVATVALPAGSWVQPGQLSLQAHLWPAGVAPAKPAAQPPSGRLRKGLRAGEAVRPGVLMNVDEKRRGDEVTVTMRSGGMTIEMPAVLSADAKVGQPVRAQLKGRREVVSGLLANSSTVWIDP